MLIDDYLIYLKASEGKSDGTIVQYKNSMNLFMKYMKENEFNVTRESIKKIKLVHIYGFLASITKAIPKDKSIRIKKDKGNSSSSRRNKISALKSFFEYCKTIEVLKHNIVIDIVKQPKKDKRFPRYFRIEECKKLVEMITGRNSTRNRMILVLFLNTGLRLEELTNLNIDCVKDNSLTVIGKGNKPRIIYLDDSIILSLKTYISTRIKTDSDALFLSEMKQRISKSAVQNLVNNTIDKAGLNPNEDNDVSVHTLRHTFATLSFQAGVSMRTLQMILGHEDISTTQLYVHVADEQMVEAARINPLRAII